MDPAGLLTIRAMVPRWRSLIVCLSLTAFLANALPVHALVCSARCAFSCHCPVNESSCSDGCCCEAESDAAACEVTPANGKPCSPCPCCPIGHCPLCAPQGPVLPGRCGRRPVTRAGHRLRFWRNRPASPLRTARRTDPPAPRLSVPVTVPPEVLSASVVRGGRFAWGSCSVCCRGNTASATCSAGPAAALLTLVGADAGRAAGARRRRLHPRPGGEPGRQRRPARGARPLARGGRRTSRTPPSPAGRPRCWPPASTAVQRPLRRRRTSRRKSTWARASHRRRARRRRMGLVRGVTPAAAAGPAAGADRRGPLARPGRGAGRPAGRGQARLRDADAGRRPDA